MTCFLDFLIQVKSITDEHHSCQPYFNEIRKWKYSSLGSIVVHLPERPIWALERTEIQLRLSSAWSFEMPQQQRMAWLSIKEIRLHHWQNYSNSTVWHLYIHLNWTRCLTSSEGICWRQRQNGHCFFLELIIYEQRVRVEKKHKKVLHLWKPLINEPPSNIRQQNEIN